tara:strand:+ start:823 stop:1929 length:1107 start_codon:yes stop_codon:yes gene_type:complete
MKHYDYLVIGAGVIGHAIAFRLKRMRPRLRIAVAGDPMNSLMASRAAAGMLAPFAECKKADRFFGFCRESLEKYPDFIEELGAASGTAISFSMAGSLMPRLMVGDRWEERLSFFREQRIEHEIWSAEEVRKRVPELSEECGDVIWVQQGQVNNRQLHDALLRAAEKLDIDVLNHNISGMVFESGKIHRAITEGGEMEAGAFILAGGSWSVQLADILDVFLPLKPVKGQMCRMKVPDDTLKYTISGYLTYIAPWGGGQGLVLGSTMEDRGFDPAIDEQVIRKLIDKAARILPRLKDAPLVESWAGLRPAAEDGMPVMGVSAKYDNLFYSTGHFRNGILQTPNQADYMADVVLKTGRNEIPEFSPSRYQL